MNTTEPEITTETPESKPVKKWSKWKIIAIIAAAILVIAGTVYACYFDRINAMAQMLFSGETSTNDGIYSGDLSWGT